MEKEPAQGQGWVWAVSSGAHTLRRSAGKRLQQVTLWEVTEVRSGLKASEGIRTGEGGKGPS